MNKNTFTERHKTQMRRKSSPSLDLVAKACRAICQEAAARKEAKR
jgi:hypothetical protein